jgi:hypothetical protein
MKSKNKPIRMSSIKELKYKLQHKNDYSKFYGVTNWMVGTCKTPLSPWVQIHIGYFCIQIKWYLIVSVLIIASFILGTLY